MSELVETQIVTQAVYLAYHGEYDHSLVGVFTSEERALLALTSEHLADDGRIVEVETVQGELAGSSVWLAWHGEYEHNSVVGVFADEVSALCALLMPGVMAEGREVDEVPLNVALQGV